MKKISYFLIFFGFLFFWGCENSTDKKGNLQDKLGAFSEAEDHVIEGKLQEEFYSNGQIKNRGRFTEDQNGTEVKNGLYEQWYENGQKEGEYRYLFGKEHGQTTRWHDNGIKAFDCYFENGEPLASQCGMWLYDGSSFSFPL